MPYRAVLFDLDGTLLDTLPDIAFAANRALERNGLPTHSLDEYRRLVGEGVQRLFEKAIPTEGRSPEVVDRCVRDFRDVYGTEWNVRTQPYAGIAELLDELTSRGVRLAVLSNKPDDFTKQCVAEYLGRWNIWPVLGQRDAVPRKPDPAGALETAAMLAIPAAEFLYLGDSEIDMQTAVRAGMRAVGATWGYRSVEELRAGGAAEIIGRPEELARLF